MGLGPLKMSISSLGAGGATPLRPSSAAPFLSGVHCGAVPSDALAVVASCLEVAAAAAVAAVPRQFAACGAGALRHPHLG